ncbi:hypothetical protein RBU64_15840 [Bacillus cereus]|nr:hypothetical protein [Bacillus cereus]
MNGKRLVVFILISLILVNTFVNNIKKLIPTLILSIGLILGFNAIYSNYLDSEYQLNKFSNDEYLQFRIDYSRDHNVKMAIYDEVKESQQKILDYRGQSFLYNLAFFIPRENWEDKPYPYGVYVTAASLGISSQESLGWQMTTSILDESIANLGLPLGICFFILLFGLIVKIGYFFKEDILLFASTNFIILLLLTMQYSFSNVFILPWCGLVICKYISTKVKFSIK